jgi:ABC-type polysaccharide/polyol phosphate transport system ATPase subunit
LETIATFATTCALLDHGRLLDIGKPDKVIRSYEAIQPKDTAA